MRNGWVPDHRANEARPNIVLVVLDTLTADAAGLGRTPTRMPALERMAEQGLVFTHAVSTAPWTLPAHGSLFSGLLPSEHGMDTTSQFLVWDRSERSALAEATRVGPKTRPGLAERWLPALLVRSGYDTIMASNNPWVSRLTQMDHGFRQVRDSLSTAHRAFAPVPAAARIARSALRAACYSYRAWRGQGDLSGRETVDRVRRWLAARDPERPFFLFINLIEAHAPYLTPASRAAVMAAGATPADVFSAMRLAEPRGAIPFNLGTRQPEDAVRSAILRVLHRSAAGYLDGLIADLRTATSQRAGRHTVFCVTSDHGESFGEHGALLHGFTVHEQALHVPLVLVGPGFPSSGRDGTADLRRVYTTLLDSAGTDSPVDAPPSLLDGAPAVAAAERNRISLPSWAPRHGDIANEMMGRMQVAYRDPWKLIRSATRTRLFDLSMDPSERDDVAASQPGVVHELLAALPKAIESVGPRDDLPAGTRLTPEEEQATAERLAALGYLE